MISHNNPTSPAAPTIRRLVASDIPIAHELRRLAGWNQTERDWAGYLDFEPEGCFAAEIDGRVIGTGHLAKAVTAPTPALKDLADVRPADVTAKDLDAGADPNEWKKKPLPLPADEPKPE